MGILDSVIGGLLGGGGREGEAGRGGSPLGDIASNLLGGQGGGASGLGGIASSFLGGQGGAGGLGGLVQQFEQAGLGDVARSWVGNGANQPVSPDQLRGVFGEDQTRAMADQAGMDHGDFLQQLSEHLPRAVDGATPDGQMPGGSMDV